MASAAKALYWTAKVAEEGLLLVMGGMVKKTFLGLVRLVRPRQWVKNSFVFAPLLFAGRLGEAQAAADAMEAFLVFCLASSAIYIVNDMRDVASDRLHPTKSKTRPLASGDVSIAQAAALLAALAIVLAAAAVSNWPLMQVIGIYLLLNLAYTFLLKDKPVIDLFIIAFGFVLRVFAGAVAIAVPVSSWMFVTTLSLALYLAAVKRRQELATSGASSRKVLQHYSIDLVNRYAEMSATGALLFYSLYVMSEHSELVITIPIVLYGLFRYWYIVEVRKQGESPTDALFADWQLPVTVVAWGVTCAWVLN